MASLQAPPDFSFHVPMAAKHKPLKHDVQQKRKEELEIEVSMLVKMLDHEEKVNKILKHTINRPDGSTIHIPSFLPPKVKELLGELAMVENEIDRLETEISHLHKLQLTRNAKSQQDRFSAEPNPRSTFQGMVNDTKAMYFISKAIKGDYTSSPLTLKKTEDDADHQNFKKPNLTPKFSTTKAMEVAFDQFPSKNVNNNPAEDQKRNPNKLSESIIKCLIFIFVRLLRTSRATELERLGATVSRLSSTSFRVETKIPLALQKESKQQDPYDIFEIGDSVPRDIGPYKNLVRFTSTSLDPRSVSSSSSSPLLQKLRVLLNNLQTVDLTLLTQHQQLAFWINMYNACIMHGFLQYGVPSGHENLFALMNRAVINVGGNKVNAIEIEHCILRQPASSNSKDVYWKGEGYAKESHIRSLYGLESSHPNIAFALCCGTRSSPAVRIYSASGISMELEKSKLDYLQAAIVVTNGKRLMLPELLLRNMFDFARDLDSLVEWVGHQLPTSGSLRKSMVECFRGRNVSKLSDIVDKIPYDFEFQYLLSV
ncbi:hypothetical protein ACHQM5_020581 [Ranunculus cassubicifolius]